MNEDVPDKPAVAEKPAVERQESNPLLETAQGFVADESEGYREAIASRASEEATRPGLMKRMVTSAKARMAMTILAGATALAGGSPQAEAGIKETLKGIARGVGPDLERGGYLIGREEEIRAEQARQYAERIQGIHRDAEYKLGRIEHELATLRERLDRAHFDAQTLAAVDQDAQDVRDIMMERTAVKIEIWKASYAGDEAKVEELSRKNRELEESLIPHLRRRPAQRTGGLFVRTIIPDELRKLDLALKEQYLQRVKAASGAALDDAVARYEAHTRRAQSAYNLANLGAAIGSRSRY